MLGTRQHFLEAHKDTASAWAATVTATTGVALSLPRGSGAGSDRDRGAFIRIYQPLCPQLQSRGLTEGLQQSGCDSGLVQALGSRFPLLLSQEPAQPWGRILSLCAEGNLSGFFVADETRGCLTSQCNFKRPRMAHDLPSHIPWCVCVCVFSLSLSQSHRAVLIDCPQLQLKVQPASL